MDYQALALMSLLLNTDFNFKLIGNGLDQQEASLLKQISMVSDRLVFINYESNNIIPHGSLVEMLFFAESAELFSFCDSDLFMFEQLQTDQILKHMSDHQVFSSGGRIENEDDAIYAGFKGGATTVSPDGQIDLATSFFCVYQRQFLQQTMDQYGVGFEQYRFAEQIPAAAMAEVTALNLTFDMFDTGKLLSVLMHQQGGHKYFTEIPGLTHIGGMSGRYLQKLDMNAKTITLSDDDLPDFENTRVNQFQQRNEYEKSLKRFYGRYFYSFLKHQIGAGPEPILAAKDERIIRTVHSLESSIKQVIDESQQDPACRAIWQLVQT